MIGLLVIFPVLISSLISIVLSCSTKTQSYSKYVVIAGTIISSLIAFMFVFVAPNTAAINWFSLGGINFNIEVTFAPINMALLLLVAAIAPLVMLYSFGYIDKPNEQPRFYAEMGIFTSAMMLFAISASFLTMFIGWEILGVMSYLLIGFWYRKAHVATSARKAITTIIIGDIAMLMAMVVIWNGYHTFTFLQIIAAPSSLALKIALPLIMVAAFTKSAQFPFQEWLADAMAGPTPVSSFLHSSTMVKAGVFIIIVLLPLFASAGLLDILIIVGIISAVIGATNAITEINIKRVLAYSTIEDLGLMFIALGFNSVAAAMLLFIVQGFYKALLFMSAGVMIKANDGDEDIRRAPNMFWHKAFIAATIIGVLSIAGIFPLSGFFGKFAVESVATNFAVYVVLIIISFTSSIYIFRWLLIPSRTKSLREENKNIAIPKSMLIPIYILAAFVVGGALIYFYLPQYLNVAQISINLFRVIIESVVVIAGAITAYFVYKKKQLELTSGYAYELLHSSSSINRFYDYTVMAFEVVSKGIYNFDYALFSLVDAGSTGIIHLSRNIRGLIDGKTSRYLLAFVIGIAILIILFVIL